MYDKSQTYSVEGTNADLRHYLARLARRSRCFSRCIRALTRAVDLFVRCYNARQLRKRKYPKYPAPLTAMIYRHSPRSTSVMSPCISSTGSNTRTSPVWVMDAGVPRRR